jgi:hypothetical protein
MKKEHLTNNNSEKLLVNILWTGGFDSSFRMVQLSKLDVTVQPYYLSDKKRHSEQNELNAISAITIDIKKHPDTKGIILPLIKLKVSEIEKDSEISQAYERLRKITLIGPQYDWLARFAKMKQGLELCLEKGESTRARNCILKYGSLKNIIENQISYCIINEEESAIDLLKVFGSFHFPLPLFEITKVEMQEEYKKMGFEETMYKTWFCHRPVNNEPCGICNPCKSVIEECMTFRLSPAGLKRFKTDTKYGDFIWFRYWKKIRRRIVGY